MSASKKNLPATPGNPQSRPRVVRTPAFDKALESLGSSDRARVLAAIGEFEKDWVGGRPIEEIRDQWNFKPFHVRKSCKPNHIHQFNPTKDTRAWTAPNPRQEQPAQLLLHVIRKSNKAEQDRIVIALCKELTTMRGAS